MNRIRLDHKGQGMLLLAVGWLAIGWSSTEPLPPHSWVWHESLPLPVRVGIWWTPAAVAVFTAFRPGRPCRSVAFFLLMLSPGQRAVSYLTGWVVAARPGPPEGYARGWVAALTYLLLMAFVWHVARGGEHDTDDLARAISDALTMTDEERVELRGTPPEAAPDDPR